MGKDKTRDENAAASSNTKDRDQESRNANSRDQDTRDTSLARAIAEAVAQQTQAITDVFQRQMEETRAQYEELLRQVTCKTSLLPLRSHPVQTVSE